MELVCYKTQQVAYGDKNQISN